MSKKSILMIVGDYVEDYEVMVPLRRFRWSATLSMPSVPAKNRRVRAHLHPRFRGRSDLHGKARPQFRSQCDLRLGQAEEYDALMIPAAARRNTFD